MPEIWLPVMLKSIICVYVPFSFFNEMTCNPEQQEELSTNGSYPSGHTAIGWATALVLAEINPDRQNEILKRGFEMGQSRVICGYHSKVM